MMYSKDALNGADACNCFALARTDLSVSLQLQTVETPSQVRYVDHIEAMLHDQRAYCDVPVVQPPVSTLDIRRVVFNHFFGPRFQSRELVAAVHVAVPHRNGSGWHSKVHHWSERFTPIGDGSASVDFSNLRVAGDIRFSVFVVKDLLQARSNSPDGLAFSGDLAETAEVPRQALKTERKRMLAGREPGCCMYFFFHSTFVDHSSGCVAVPTSQVDKAWKNKRKFRSDGSVRLDFVVQGQARTESRVSARS